MARQLGRKQFALYTERKGLSTQISELEARLAKLKKERKLLDHELIGESFFDGGERSLPNGRVLNISRVDVNPLTVTPDMQVGHVIREGYTYYKFKEQSPE